jgi:hypothetical protein
MFASRSVIALAFAAVMAAVATQPAMARSGVKVGVLKCNVSSGVGFVFGSSRRVSCVYVPTDAGRREFYTGSINKWGVDIGYIKEGTMIWAVFAPSSNVRPGALAGDYGGISADVAVGYGVGAKALIGGFKKSIALQPLSISGIKGFNVAAGVASLNLKQSK